MIKEILEGINEADKKFIMTKQSADKDSIMISIPLSDYPEKMLFVNKDGLRHPNDIAKLYLKNLNKANAKDAAKILDKGIKDGDLIKAQVEYR